MAKGSRFKSEAMPAMSGQQLISKSPDLQAYEVELDSKKYQVEVELLERTDTYITISVAVDDGGLAASIAPLTHTFVRQKTSDRLMEIRASLSLLTARDWQI